jgi:hypothetical protein
MDKKQVIQKQDGVKNMIKIARKKMQCNITTQHINMGAPWVLAKKSLRRSHLDSMQSHENTK